MGALPYIQDCHSTHVADLRQDFADGLRRLRPLVTVTNMATGVRVAYPVVFLGLLTAGFFLDVSWWVGALIGLAVVVPIMIADFLLTRRQTADSHGD